jgi:Ca2+-binding EF-hand superfamily protein
LQEAFYALDEDGDGHLTPAELTHALRSTDALAKSGFAAEIPPEALEELIAASDLYGEGYVDVDEFLAAMLANSNYTKTKDAVSKADKPVSLLRHACAGLCADMLTRWVWVAQVQLLQLLLRGNLMPLCRSASFLTRLFFPAATSITKLLTVLHLLLLQLRRSFDALDHDHDGFITSADLLNLQQQLLGEHHMTKELAEEMMSEVSSCIDESHDGKMNYQEVCAQRCMLFPCVEFGISAHFYWLYLHHTLKCASCVMQ